MDVLLGIVLGFISSIVLCILIIAVPCILWHGIVIAWQKSKIISVLVVIGLLVLPVWLFITHWEEILASLFILAAIVFGLFWLVSGGWDRETRRAKKLKNWTGQDYEDFWDERDES